MSASSPTGQQRYASLIEWARWTIAYSRAVAAPEFSSETPNLILEIEVPQADEVLKAIRAEIRHRRGETIPFAAAAAELIPAVLNVVRKSQAPVH